MIPSPKSSTPPSRSGKRQLMVFLKPAFSGLVRKRAAVEEKTVQELLGEAMNAALASHGRKEVFPAGHQRFMVRKNSAATPRSPEKTSVGRRGRASLSGWFDIKCLDLANSVASEMGLTLQDLAESGLQMLMKRPARQPDRLTG